MKRALITGGTRGIGLACVKKFLREGFFVTALYSSDSDAADRAAALFPQAEFLRADVADERDVIRIFRHLPTLDVLVNNAGVSLVSQIQDTSFSDFTRVMNVNAGGCFLCSRHAVEKFLARGGGAIVNISSVWGETGGSCETVYSASKGAVIAFSKALAKELAPARVTVNCVCPGAVDTSMNAHLSPDERLALEADIPLGRFGTPDEIADAVFFLAGHPYITGQSLSVNGGWFI